MSNEERTLSEVVWTPERGLSQEPEIRSIAWNELLTGDEYAGRWRTDAGVKVTPETALQSTVVLACCRILAESISSMPLHVYRRAENGDKILARDIPLYRVLSFAPNSWQTKFEFFEQMVMTLCLWGNSYTQIQSGRYGAVTELINLHPSRMDVERLENGRLRYSYTNPETGRLERYTQDQIMHVRWTPEPDGIKGMVPVEVAREAIALARACEIHASKYWSNSARPGVVLQTDGSLSAEAAERLRDNWERLHRGVQQSWRTAVLTNGLKAEPLGFTQEQSQFIDSRRFQSEEICRVYRLPVHLVQGQSGGNLETSGQEFVTYTLMPWLKRIESAISRSLIYNDDMFVAEFDARGLLRGDSGSRAAFYSTMTGLGVLSINEVRRLENLTPLGKEGDHHFVAMNMQTLEQADAAANQPPPAAAPPGAVPGGPPAPVPGGVPSLPEVKKGEAPKESPKGIASQPKQEGRSLSPQNQSLYDAQEEIVKENGKWPQQGPGGAHYMEENPFAARGIACRNCIYFQNGNQCEVVEGAVAANAICKLWIIPEEKLSMQEERDCGTGSGGFKSGNKCAGQSQEDTDPSESPVRGLRRGKKNEKQTRVARKLYQMGTTERKVKQMIGKLGGKPSRSSVDMQDGKVNIFVRDNSGNELYHLSVGYNGAHVESVDPITDKKAEEIVDVAREALPNAISDRLYGAGKEYPVTVGHGSKTWDAPKKKDLRAFCPTGQGGGLDNSCAAMERLAADSDSGGGSSSGSSSSSDRNVTARKILEQIARNPAGFTIDKQTADQPSDGIMVSEFPNDDKRSLQLKAEELTAPGTDKVLANWISQNQDALSGRPDRFLGGWLAGGTYFIDISTRFEPNQAEQALKAGRKAGQLAVFNLGTKKETWVKYEKGDDRKPDGWDNGFAKARKSSAESQVYDPESPDLQEEDHAAELTKHGTKTVRSLGFSGYTSDVAQQSGEAQDEQRRDQASGRALEGLSPGGVPGVSGLRGEDRGISGEETPGELVQGRSGRQAGTVPGPAAGRLIAEIRSLGQECDIEFNGNVSTSLYDDDGDVLFVDPSLSEEDAAGYARSHESGWLSQPNPLLHELCHRHHASANRASYDASIGVTFSDEQRNVISSEVSRYACTNAREFMAEFIAGGIAGKQYSEAVVSIYEMVLNDLS